MAKPLEERLERATVSRSILNKIRADIIFRKYLPGTRLIESQLAEEFAVSRGRIREVLTVIEQEGIIDSLSNGGTLVVGFSEKMASDVYDLRLYFETKALEIILQQPMVNYGNLVSALDLVTSKVHQLDIQQLFDIDVKFHRGLFLTADNRPLMRCWNNLASLIYAVLSVNASTDYSKDYIYEFYEKHKVIIDYIIEKNPKCIEQMTTHILDAKRMTLDILRNIKA